MNIKHFEIEIPQEAPFANCKLERKKYADVLTKIVDSYDYGFVLAINNKWGTGKTTFVKMWEQDLKNKEHKTIYFNAWENDFEDNPLTALMGELKSLTTKSTEPEFKNTLKKAALLSKHIAPIIAQAIADKYIDTKGIKDAFVGVTEGLSDVFENEVNEYAEKKKSISEFKRSLSEFIENTYKGKPLIFIIDELDRCRPNYAVAILEQIKHFFSVPNVIFILSIDKIQLGNAIKGVYGSDHIDSDEYLRRFIDIEYSIPEPEENTFYKYLFDYFEFKDFFDSAERKKYGELNSDTDSFLRICKLIFNNRNIPLRQQERIFGLARLALRSFNVNSYVLPRIFLFLTYLKISKHKFYDGIKKKILSLEEVQEAFLKEFEINKSENSENELIWIEAYLIHFYNNYLKPRHSRMQLYEKDSESGKNKLLISSKINPDRDERFLSILERIYWRDNLDGVDLGYFIKKIELLDVLVQ